MLGKILKRKLIIL